MRIATIDEVVNAIDDAREDSGSSKAELARAIQKEPATIRRLLSSDNSNPTLGTLAEVAAALGLRITVEPIPKSERGQITGPLLGGRAADPRNSHVTSARCVRRRRRVPPDVMPVSADSGFGTPRPAGVQRA